MARLRGGDSRELGGHDLRTRAVARSRHHRGVSVGSNGSQLCDATIRDVSTHGCRIDTHAGWLRVGAFVSVRLDDEAAVMGIVRWLRGGSAGIEFLRPIRPGDEAWQALFDEQD